MSLGTGPIGQGYAVVGRTVRGRFASSEPAVPAVPATARDRVELGFGAPPLEVLVEVDRAFDRAHELAAQNRELHFTTDRENGRVIVQIRDLDGNILRTIPNEQALEILGGAAL
jgi:hypothetical protein